MRTYGVFNNVNLESSNIVYYLEKNYKTENRVAFCSKQDTNER